MVISDFAIKRPMITVVTMVALVVFGLFALWRLQTDEFPDIQQPVVLTFIPYPGASPEGVERELLKPVEDYRIDLAKRFADAVKATDQAGAEFMLEHKRFLDWKRSMSVVLTREGQALIDVELAGQLDGLGQQAVMVWASVARFPARNKIATKEAAAKGAADIATTK